MKMNRLHYMLYIICTIKYSQLLLVYFYIYIKIQESREGAIVKLVRLNAKKKIYAVFPRHKGRIKLNYCTMQHDEHACIFPRIPTLEIKHAHCFKKKTQTM